ncbi:unnamed protein product [Cylicocyclus nassatus]|uniref:Uncharacterized protein n=1 Tax=Cylicocyclus nassatus TaxID=53992 RepID=A0AA36HAK5_CYLNA|nr:unnamed protein product [Cylicocyclus nassatus]
MSDEIDVEFPLPDTGGAKSSIPPRQEEPRPQQQQQPRYSYEQTDHVVKETPTYEQMEVDLQGERLSEEEISVEMPEEMIVKPHVKAVAAPTPQRPLSQMPIEVARKERPPEKTKEPPSQINMLQPTSIRREVDSDEVDVEIEEPIATSLKKCACSSLPATLQDSAEFSRSSISVSQNANRVAVNSLTPKATPSASTPPSRIIEGYPTRKLPSSSAYRPPTITTSASKEEYDRVAESPAPVQPVVRTRPSSYPDEVDVELSESLSPSGSFRESAGSKSPTSPSAKTAPKASAKKIPFSKARTASKPSTKQALKAKTRSKTKSSSKPTKGPSKRNAKGAVHTNSATSSVPAHKQQATSASVQKIKRPKIQKIQHQKVVEKPASRSESKELVLEPATE